MTHIHGDSIGGDKVGGDKFEGDKVAGDKLIINNYYGGADGLSRELMRAPSPQPLRVLAVIASPVAGRHDDEPPPAHLSGRAEWARLREAAKVAPMLLARLRPPTIDQLRVMAAPNTAGAFNIVHFICHGAPGALALEDERGLTAVVPAAEIARDVRDGQIDLVVVNACYSAAGEAQSIAEALIAAGVRSVVAHHWPLIDRAAVVFSQALYRELAAGRSLRTAFDEAVRITTDRFDAERGNAVLLGDEALAFPRPSGPVQRSHVVEGPSLPDETARFFGRRRELLKLADLFANEHLRGAALTGIGGIGKSALAFEAADRHAWRFPGGVAYVRASEFGFNLDAALIDLARTLGVDVSGNPARNLLAYLNTTPCLLVLDNLERAERELPRLADFVNALNFDAGSKVLLTLRPPLSDRFRDLREINLHDGLDADNALAYVQFIAANEGAPLQWQNPAEAGALADRVKGHPELMRLTVFRSKQTPWARVKQELANLSGRLDEALQELIGKQVEQAGEWGKIALARLALFPQPRMLCEAAQAACGEAADGLDKLVQAGVIALEQGITLKNSWVQRYVLHSTVLDWVHHNTLVTEVELQNATVRAAKSYKNSSTEWWDPFESRNVLHIAESVLSFGDLALAAHLVGISGIPDDPKVFRAYSSAWKNIVSIDRLLGLVDEIEFDETALKRAELLERVVTTAVGTQESQEAEPRVDSASKILDLFSSLAAMNPNEMANRRDYTVDILQQLLESFRDYPEFARPEVVDQIQGLLDNLLALPDEDITNINQ